MTSDTEQALERLVLLMETYGSDGIPMWQAERKQASEDRAARLQDANVYYIGLMGERQVRDMVTGGVRTDYAIVERFPIAYEDIPYFCREHGLRQDVLMDVLELRRLEVSANGRTWRAGKGTYIDRSTLMADREKAIQEDARNRARYGDRLAAASVPSTVPMFAPTGDWRKL